MQLLFMLAFHTNCCHSFGRTGKFAWQRIGIGGPLAVQHVSHIRNVCVFISSPNQFVSGILDLFLLLNFSFSSLSLLFCLFEHTKNR